MRRLLIAAIVLGVLALGAFVALLLNDEFWEEFWAD